MSTMIKMATFLLLLNLTYYISVNMIFVPYDVDTMDSCEYKLVGDTCHAPLEYELGIYQVPGDIIDIIFKDNVHTAVSNYQQGYKTVNFDLQDQWQTEPEQAGGESIGTDIISYLDAIKIIWSIIPTLFNIALTPLMLFFASSSNLMIVLLLGVPYVIIFVLTIFFFIRGASD